MEAVGRIRVYPSQILQRTTDEDVLRTHKESAGVVVRGQYGEGVGVAKKPCPQVRG